jgi:DNA-binding NarL/FixJ family response regulator
MDEVELDERARELAIDAAITAVTGHVRRDTAAAMIDAGIRAYLRTAGLVSVPVVKE